MTETDVEALIRCLTGHYVYASEVDLHFVMGAVMEEAGIAYEPEVRITGGRIDFLVGRIGVEVKIKGTRNALAQQLARYAASDLIDDLLVVTTRQDHRHLPPVMGAKPVHVLYLGGIL